MQKSEGINEEVIDCNVSEKKYTEALPFNYK